MKGDESPNNLSRSEEETSEINLEVKNVTSKNTKKKSQNRRKIKEKIFAQNLNEITLPQRNLKYYNDDNTYYKFVGKSIFLFMNSNDDPLIIIGPDWPMVACLFSLFNFFYISIIIKFWVRFDLSGKLVNQISYWIFMISFLHTSLINQGYPKNTPSRRNGHPKENYYYCGECQFYVERTIDSCHCDKCGICIEGQDHHCAWIGKCVGKNNAISFYIFIVSAIFSMFYILMAFPKIFK